MDPGRPPCDNSSHLFPDSEWARAGLDVTTARGTPQPIPGVGMDLSMVFCKTRSPRNDYVCAFAFSGVPRNALQLRLAGPPPSPVIVTPTSFHRLPHTQQGHQTQQRQGQTTTHKPIKTLQKMAHQSTDNTNNLKGDRRFKAIRAQRGHDTKKANDTVQNPFAQKLGCAKRSGY